MLICEYLENIFLYLCIEYTLERVAERVPQQSSGKGSGECSRNDTMGPIVAARPRCCALASRLTVSSNRIVEAFRLNTLA